MKKLKFFTALTTVLLLSIMMLTLTSKAPDDVFNEPTPCDEIIGEGDSRQIRIAFNESQYPNPFRKSSYTGYIPTPDLRTGYFPGAAMMSHFQSAESSKYYAVVTITSPQCDAWEWREVFDSTNGNSNGVMNVKIPIDGYDARVQIKYYERIDAYSGAPDFNLDVGGSCLNSSRVLYSFDYVFLNGWGGNIPQPMTMIPASNTTIGCPPGLSDDYGIVNKSPNMSDYNSVNQYIEINNLNPE